jgi:hypothetical protein
VIGEGENRESMERCDGKISLLFLAKIAYKAHSTAIIRILPTNHPNVSANQRGAVLRWVESFGAEATAIPGDRRQVEPPEAALHRSVPGAGFGDPETRCLFQFASVRVLRWAETPVRGEAVDRGSTPSKKYLIFCLPFSEKITYNGREHELALGARRKNVAQDEFEKTEKTHKQSGKNFLKKPHPAQQPQKTKRTKPKEKQKP